VPTKIIGTRLEYGDLGQ